MRTSIKIKIRGFHIDLFKHVNNARYLEFLEEGRWDYSEKNYLFSMFEEKGIDHVTVNININYRKSAFCDQVLRVETGVLKAGHKSVTMRQTVFLDDTETIIAEADVTNVYLDSNTREILTVDKELAGLWSDLANIKLRSTHE